MAGRVGDRGDRQRQAGSGAEGRSHADRLPIGELQHGIEAAQQDRRDVTRRRQGRGLQDGVGDDIDATAAHPPPRPLQPQQRVWKDEQGGRNTAVDVHFFVDPTAGPTGDHARRKNPRQAGGRGQDLPKESDGVRFSGLVHLAGDRTEIPDAGALSIQVGGRHEQATALGVRGRYGLQQGCINEGRDQAVECGGAEQARLQARGRTAQGEERRSVTARVGVLETAVPGGAKEGERGDQGPGADAGDQGELRTPPGPR